MDYLNSIKKNIPSFFIEYKYQYKIKALLNTENLEFCGFFFVIEDGYLYKFSAFHRIFINKS